MSYRYSHPPGLNPRFARREGNRRFLTNQPRGGRAHISSSSQEAPKTAPSLAPPVVDKPTKTEEPPALLPPNSGNQLLSPLKNFDQHEEEPADDDHIIYIGDSMSDSKTDSKATGGVATSTAPKRDESRGRDRGADSSSRDRRPGNSRGGGHSARHSSSIGRRDGSRGGPQRRDSNSNMNSSRYGGGSTTNTSFMSQMKSGDGRGPPMLQPPSAFTQEIPKKKFTTRCRLFVGNLPNEMKEEDFKKLFTEFGEISEVFLSGKGFGFLRLDTRAHAETAKEALDGKAVMGRQLRVRFAVHGATIRVKELSAMVSNEILYNTFSIFGEVERAIHIVDERGKPTGEGIVEFERKATAQEALRNIEDRVFIMTAQSHPISVEIMEPKDEEDGLAERMIQRTAQTMKEREIPPHFADEKSFEFMYGMRWKELYKFEKAQREQLEKDLEAKRRQLEADMEIAYDDYRAEMIRDELEQRQRELERLEEAKRNRAQQMGNRPDFGGNPWNQPQRPFDDFPGMHPPQFGHPPLGHNGPPPMNAFDGPQGRSNPTFGREPPRFFGGGAPEDNDHRHGPGGPQDKQPFGPEIEKILQTFRTGDEPPPNHGGRPMMGRGPGQYDNFGGPPPFNASLVPPPLFSMPGNPMKHQSQHGSYKPPSEKRSRR